MYNQKYWVENADSFTLKIAINEVLEISGFSILQFIEYHFQPYGYTGLWLLAESHAAIHTFPEENKSYIELSSCVEEFYLRFKLNFADIMHSKHIELI